MKLEITRIDESLPLPNYQTNGSVAFDLYSRVCIDIEPFVPTIIPSNLIIKVPEDHVLIIAARSSLAIKKGLILGNGIGIIDQDYHGAKDEIGIQVINITKNVVRIEKQDRVAQGMIVRVAKVSKFEEVDSKNINSRGGFGSTGGHS